MRNALTASAVAVIMALSTPVFAQSSSSSGTVGTNVGTSMNQPMVVNTDNGNVHMQPNATSTILTMVPKGHQVTVIGTANGGAWAHVSVDGLDGYMDMVQLEKAPAYNAYNSDGYNYNNGYATYYSVPNQAVRYMAVTSDGAIVR